LPPNIKSNSTAVPIHFLKVLAAQVLKKYQGTGYCRPLALGYIMQLNKNKHARNLTSILFLLLAYQLKVNEPGGST